MSRGRGFLRFLSIDCGGWCFRFRHGAGLFRVPPPHQSFRHRMHGGFERPAIGLVQRCLHGGFNDPIQLIHIHIDPAT